jgi:hypothetical protein
MATKTKKGKKATAAAATEDAATEAKAPRNQFAGKSLVITEAGKAARRNPAGRRTASWNTLTENANRAGRLSYEEYIEKGGRHDDLATMARLGHVETK